MNYFYGENKKRSFFEGWYFSHKKDGCSIAFIPGMNVDGQGNKSAFIQVIVNDASYNICYDYDEFKADRKKLCISVGNSTFSEDGADVDIEGEGILCKGRIGYGPFTALGNDIMGPFSFVPFMECRHGVVSMRHKLSGGVSLNGTHMDFEDGTGYIEKDWGSSFPKRYLWVQCNSFEDSRGLSIMASVADIPFLGGSFDGCICAIFVGDREYRLATYNGAKIERWDENGLLLRQRGYILEIIPEKSQAQRLLAPSGGFMSRTIHESTDCRVAFKFYRRDAIIFTAESDNSSYEYVESAGK